MAAVSGNFFALLSIGIALVYFFVVHHKSRSWMTAFVATLPLFFFVPVLVYIFEILIGLLISGVNNMAITSVITNTMHSLLYCGFYFAAYKIQLFWFDFKKSQSVAADADSISKVSSITVSPPVASSDITSIALKIKPTTLFLLALVLYFGSLALPAVVYQPSLLGNPKYESGCDGAEQQNLTCELVGSHLDCGDQNFIKASNVKWTPLTDEQLATYCAGYDVPQESVDTGWSILLLGWLGILMLVFAWYANIIACFALLFSRARLPQMNRIGLGLSLASFFVGLDSFAFHQKLLDESVSDSLYVDHLGIGFYAWELSLLILAAYFYVRLQKSKRFVATAPTSAVHAASRSAGKWFLGIFLFLFILIPIVVWVFDAHYQQQQQQNLAHNKDLSTVVSSPPSGLLVPTENSVPDGFIQSKTSYTKGGYDITYTSASTSYVSIRFMEFTAAENVTYADEIKQFQKFNSNANIENFTYEGSPGFLYHSHTVSPPDLDNYQLYWNDSGKSLQITIEAMPPGQYPSSESVIDIIGTLQRS